MQVNVHHREIQQYQILILRQVIMNHVQTRVRETQPSTVQVNAELWEEYERERIVLRLAQVQNINTPE